MDTFFDVLSKIETPNPMYFSLDTMLKPYKRALNLENHEILQHVLDMEESELHEPCRFHSYPLVVMLETPVTTGRPRLLASALPPNSLENERIACEKF